MAMGLRSATKAAATEETDEEREAREEAEREKKKSMKASGYVRGGREARQKAMDEAGDV